MGSKKNVLPRIHRHTLVEMNRPVFTARRDAAHARVVQILRQTIEHGTKEQRAGWYGDCLRLVEEALRSTARSQITPDCPLVHYLKLLRDTLKAQVALVTHEIGLVTESREFSRLLGEDTVARLQKATDQFSDSEKYLLDSIHDLLDFGESLGARDGEERKQTFSDDDWRRFNHATKEYEDHYSAFGR